MVIDTPLSLAELRRFCGDLERLYRINPYLEIPAWQVLGPDRFRWPGALDTHFIG